MVIIKNITTDEKIVTCADRSSFPLIRLNVAADCSLMKITLSQAKISDNGVAIYSFILVDYNQCTTL